MLLCLVEVTQSLSLINAADLGRCAAPGRGPADRLEPGRLKGSYEAFTGDASLEELPGR